MAEILTMIFNWMTDNSITWSFNGVDFSISWWSLFIAISVISLAIMIVEKIMNN